MKNRIRDFRKQRDMTQRGLADLIGTTSQSISRLETGEMTLSTDWLERLARVFCIHPTDLLEHPEQKTVPYLGDISSQGQLTSPKTNRLRQMSLEPPSDDPIAVSVAENIGPFQRGDILVCNKLAEKETRKAVGRNCLVAHADDEPFLCRVISEDSKETNRYTLVPLAQSLPTRFKTKVKWAAPLILRMTHL